MVESVKLLRDLIVIVTLAVVACGAARRGGGELARTAARDTSPAAEVRRALAAELAAARRDPLTAAELVPVLPMPSALAVEDGIPFRCLAEHGGTLIGLADAETHTAMLWIVHLPAECYDGRILFAVPRVTPMR